MLVKLKLYLLFIFVLTLTALTIHAAPATDPPPMPNDPMERMLMPHKPGLANQNNQDSQQNQPDNQTVALLPWSKVVFQSLRDGNWEIYTSQDDGSGLARLTYGDVIDVHPRFNHGSTQIVNASKEGDDYEIYVMDANGGNRVALTNNMADDVFPIWSRDNSKIAFQTYRDGQAEIYTMNADGSGVTRLTNHAASDGYPSWSPDGSKIAFMSNRTGNYRIYVMNADGSNVVGLSDQPNSLYPTWSPDGTQIAYSSDSNGDGWLDVWLMNADGTRQREIFYAYGSRDAWVSGWSPNGYFVTFTDISFILYEGNWYWTSAYARAAYIDQRQDFLINGDPLLWNPHWGTLDAVKPTSSLFALPTVSPSPIPVRWSGSDAGGSGVRNYDVQVMIGNSGVWTDWLLYTGATFAEYPGVGGETYAFRVRARDDSVNLEAWPDAAEAVTMVEALPPETAVFSLPPFTHKESPLDVSWGGIDLGNSGIQSYDVQYSINDDSWQDWQIATTDTSAKFWGWFGSGETVYFRSRAVDKAGNQEAWSDEDGDAATTYYLWSISGTTYDNTQTPISGLVSEIAPTTLANMADTPDGHYIAYSISESSPQAVTWSRAGLGDLPETWFTTEKNTLWDVYLPPADNLWVGGNFEEGTGFVGETAVSLPPSAPVFPIPFITNTRAHTGQSALQIGSPNGLFTSPQNISNASDRAERPQAVFDDAGNLHVIWTGRNDTSDFHLFHAYRSPDGNWSAPQDIASGIVSWAESVDLIVTNNVLHLIFYKNDGGIYYTYRNTAGEWSTPHRMNNGVDAESTWFKFTVASNGDVHFIWKDDHYQTIYHTRRAANGNWDASYRLSPDPIEGNVLLPNIVVDSNNNAHMVWYTYNQNGWDTQEPFARIDFVTRNANGQWIHHEPVIDLNEAVHPGSELLRLIIDDNDQPHLLWYNDMFDDSTLYYSTYNGIDWSPLYSVATLEWVYDGDIDFVADKENNLHLVFRDAHARKMIYLQRGADGSWHNADVIYQFGDNFGGHPVFLTRNENSYIAWNVSQYDSFSYIYLIQKIGEHDWSNPILISHDMDQSAYHNLVLDADNVLHIVWNDGHIGYSDSNAQVYHRIQRLAETTDETLYTQSLTLPETLTNGVLSYLYQLDNGYPNEQAGLFVDITDSSGTTTVAGHTGDTDEWTHHWVDLGAWAGEQVTVTFRVRQVAGLPLTRAFLDEVSVGSTHANVWVTAVNNQAAPGGEVSFVLEYGNSGGAVAPGTLLTMTLPSEISFMSASTAPISTNPLVWDLGALSAKSEPLTLEVTGIMASNAALFTSVTTVADISTNNELEILDNVAEIGTFIGWLNYLPIIPRP